MEVYILMITYSRLWRNS